MKRDYISDRIIGHYEKSRERWAASTFLVEKKAHLRCMTKWIVNADRYRDGRAL